MDNNDLAMGSCPQLPVNETKPPNRHSLVLQQPHLIKNWDYGMDDGSQEITVPIKQNTGSSLASVTMPSNRRQSRTLSQAFLSPKQSEDEIEMRLSQPRKSILNPRVTDTQEVVMVPLLLGNPSGESRSDARKQRLNSSASQRSVRGDGNGDPVEGMKYNLTYLDLMSMQLYAMPPSNRVISVLRRRDSELDQYHALFCELETLHTEKKDYMWKEKSRWVKYEECIEESGNRWSKPHVSMLSLQSLFEVRKTFLVGTVILDLEADTFEEIIDSILFHLVKNSQLKDCEKSSMKQLLLSRHQHGVAKESCLGEIFGPGCSKPEEEDLRDTKYKYKKEAGRVNSSHKFNHDFLKKVPRHCEAINILVGEADFLSEPVTAFVRLQSPLLLGDMPEIEIATRFIFVLLGPGDQTVYEEIGRAVATLISDEVFREMAYISQNRQELLAGLDEFMTQVTVLPPGKFDPEERIEPPYTAPSQSYRLDTKQSRFSLCNDEEDHTLKRTGRLFGGLVKDIKRRYPQYISDLRDAVSLQCLASFFFMYIACLTPVVTIGGLLGQATENNMGAIEALVSAAICGTTWHLLAGQPLTILGATGPMLVFEKILYPFCQSYGINYLPFRFWIGMWVAVLMVIIVMFDLSYLVKYITRFTEEGFAMLIALIFITEAFKKLLHINEEYPVDWHPGEKQYHDYTCFCEHPGNGSLRESLENKTAQTLRLSPWVMDHQGKIPVYRETGEHTHNYSTHTWDAIPMEMCEDVINGTLTGPGCDTPHYVADVFFFSCTLFLSTFVMAILLKEMKTSRFFPRKVRAFLCDFAVPIAILIMVVVDHFVGIHTPKLQVPEQLQPSIERSWIINPLGNPLWCIPAAIIPALLAAVLIFMDQQITAVIVNRKEHKLKKGGGYHLDLLVVGVQIGICSVLGTPWFVAATMESINHVRSLSMASKTSAPGERPKFLGVREQRLTGFLAFVLIGSSAFFSVVLQYVPMPVLFGVFFFMGVSAMKSIQLVHRILIIFMPVKYQPDHIFLRHVKLKRVHLFTAIQILCLLGLFAIKLNKTVSILFPLMVLALCFVRKAMDYVFTQSELKWLDDILPETNKPEMADHYSDSMLDVFDEDEEKQIESTALQSRNDKESGNGHVIKRSLSNSDTKPILPMVNMTDHASKENDENHNTKEV